MTARRIYLDTFRTYWTRAGFLLALGAGVFVPLGLLGALADQLTLHGENVADTSVLGWLALGGTLLAQATTSLVGELFYSGAVAVALAEGEKGKEPSLMEVARRLAYWRLIAVDILFVAGTAIGLVLFIVPGVIFFTWFALAAPIVELEGAGVRTAFGRARSLVRGHFWLVLVVLVPISFVGEVVTEAAVEGIHGLIHNPFLHDWTAEVVTSVLITPVYAVAAVLLTLGLSGRRRPATPRPS